MNFQTKEIISQRERERERVVSSHSKLKRLIFITSVLMAVLVVSSLSFSNFAKAQERKEYPAPRHSILASVSSFFKSLLFSSVKQKEDIQSSEVVPIKSQFSSSVIPVNTGTQVPSNKFNNPQLTNSTSSNANLDSRSPRTGATPVDGLRGNDRAVSSDLTRGEVLGLIQQSDDRNLALIRAIITSPSFAGSSGATMPNSITNSDSLSVQQSINNLSQRISVIQENNVRQLDHTYNSISRSFDDISSLDGVTMTNSSFSGTTGTFTGLLTGADGTFSGDITVSSELTVSGTGTSTFAGGISVGTIGNASGLTVFQNGNVGIGTTTPSGKLEVLNQNGTAIGQKADAPPDGYNFAISGRNRVNTGSNVVGVYGFGQTNDPTMNSYGGYFYGTYGSYRNKSIGIYAAGNDYAAIFGSGKVGIGTTTPQWLLNLFSATAPQLSLSAGAGISQWTFRNAGGNLYFATTTVAGTATSSISALTINNNGNVGIATTSPWRTLSVTGSMAVTGLTAGAAGDYAVCINNTTKEITNAGATGCVVSSKRFKENISELDSGLDELMQLKPSKFTYIGQTGEHMGLIAEDVDAIDKRLVEYEADGITPRTVRYLEMSALLIKSIQELNVKIDNLSQSSTTLSKATSDIGSDGLFSWIVDKFASTFGIVFGQDKVVVKNICAKKSDGSEVCVDGDQLQVLLDKNVITQTSSSASSSSSSSSVEAGSFSSSSSSSESSSSSSSNSEASSFSSEISSNSSSAESSPDSSSLESSSFSEIISSSSSSVEALSSSSSSL